MSRRTVLNVSHQVQAVAPRTGPGRRHRLVSWGTLPGGSVPLIGAGPDYLEQLLQAAINVPAAPGDPASARIAGSLLVALAERQDDARVEPYLAWAQGQPMSYEVRRYDHESRIESSDEYSVAGDAVRATQASAAHRDGTVQLIARPDGARERSMLMMRGNVAIYRMPDRGAVEPGPSRNLVERTESPPTAHEIVGLLRDVMSGVTVQVDVTAIQEVVRDAVEEARRESVATTDDGVVTNREAVDEMARAIARQLVSMLPAEAATTHGRLATRPATPLDPAAEDALAGVQEGRAAAGEPPPVPRGRPRIVRGRPRVER